MKATIITMFALLLSSHLVVAQEAAEMPSMEEMMQMMTQMAQPLEDAFLDQWVGDFHGTGNSMGITSTEETHVEWGLNHHVLRMDIHSTMTTPDGGTMEYWGTCYLKPEGEGQYTGLYIDSMGMMGDFAASAEGNALTMQWEDTPMGNGRRTMTLNEDGSWTAVEQMQGPDGSWVEVGTFTYTR